MTFHHIIFDSWSAEVLFREITQYYEYFVWGGEASGEQLALFPVLPLQVSDYAVWQRNWLNSASLNTKLLFWKNQLNNANNDLGLPFDHPRTKNPSMLGGELNFVLPSSIVDELRVLSQEQNVTIFMALFSLFNVLLFRYGHQNDLSIGIPIANRNHIEIEGLIGFFANTLVLRTIINANDTFIDLLNIVRETTIKAYDNQDLPFDFLVEELHPDRRFFRSPLFQVMFSLQPSPGEYHIVSGIELSVIPIHSGTSKFDITMVFSEESNRFKGTIEYSKDLFEQATISRFINHFLILIEDAIRDRSQVVSRMNLISESERLKLLGIGPSQLRSESIDLLKFSTLVERFRWIAERNWEREAVKSGGEVERYGELEEASNRIGRWLRRGGVREGDLVVMRMRKGIAMIEWILGIQKAGGGYVPIDLSYPKERQRQILEDVREWMGGRGMKVITEEGERGGMEEGEWEVIEKEKVREEIRRESGGREKVEIKGSDLAYVIYTSGSTGRPKGVMVEHRNVEALMERTEGLYGFGEGDIWMMFHSYGFDFSVWEIWGALGYGGKLVMVGEEEAKDTERVYRKIVEEGVTVLNQTPSAFRGLMAEEARLERRGRGGR